MYPSRIDKIESIVVVVVGLRVRPVPPRETQVHTQGLGPHPLKHLMAMRAHEQ